MSGEKLLCCVCSEEIRMTKGHWKQKIKNMKDQQSIKTNFQVDDQDNHQFLIYFKKKWKKELILC